MLNLESGGAFFPPFLAARRVFHLSRKIPGGKFTNRQNYRRDTVKRGQIKNDSAKKWMLTKLAFTSVHQFNSKRYISIPRNYTIDQHPWLRPGWPILPRRTGYCSNAKWARRHWLGYVTKRSSWVLELLVPCLNINNDSFDLAMESLHQNFNLPGCHLSNRTFWVVVAVEQSSLPPGITRYGREGRGFWDEYRSVWYWWPTLCWPHRKRSLSAGRIRGIVPMSAVNLRRSGRSGGSCLRRKDWFAKRNFKNHKNH